MFSRILCAFLLVAATSSITLAQVREVQLQELWRRGGEDDDMIFGVISQVVEDADGTLYLLDSQLHNIHVLDADGEWLRSMGRRGEGPGEFQIPGDLFFGPGDLLGIVQIFPGKIVQLTKEGDPAPLYPIEELSGANFNSIDAAKGLPDRIVVAGSESRQATTLNYLRSFGPDGKQIAEFHQEENPFVFGGMQFEEKTHRNFTQRWSLARDGRVAAALDYDAYQVHVWNPDGSLNKLVEREFPLVERSKEERELMQTMMAAFTSWNPNSSYQCADTHMTIGQLNFHPDGTLWVLPADGMWRKPAAALAEFDVFDQQGEFRERVRLLAPGDPTQDGIFFSRDRIYVVTDLLGAALSMMGGGEDDDEVVEDTAPMQIIAYAVTAQ